MKKSFSALGEEKNPLLLSTASKHIAQKWHSMGLCTSKDEGMSRSSPPEGGTMNRTRRTVSEKAGNTGTNGILTDSSTTRVDEKPNVRPDGRAGGGAASASGGTGADPNKRQQSVGSTRSAASAQSVEASGGASGGTGSSDSSKALKVLLLGSGESGKSTILQQLKILHQNGFSREELLEYRPFIFDNVIETSKDIVSARQQFQVELEPDSGVTQEDLDEVMNFSTPGSQLQQFPQHLEKIMMKVWNLPSTQNLITGEHRSAFYLMDSARYFMDGLDRISTPNYQPTVRDVLLSRKKTSGIFDTLIEMDSNLKMHIYDVGGQRSERKKWIHCFDNVTLIIFCVSLSEYDQTLLEDKTQNRLDESLILFDSVVNSRWFARASIVLFLNKIDVFAEKLQHVPLEKYFPDYTGGQDINKAAKYILWRFVQLNRAHLNIYPHVTQATDTSNIKLVFAAIKETILENSLKDSGVL